MKITAIEQEIEDFQKQKDQNEDEMQEEIFRVLKEYNGRNETLTARVEAHQQSKEKEIDALKKNEVETVRKEKGLKSFQAIVDYYETEEDGY